MQQRYGLLVGATIPCRSIDETPVPADKSLFGSGSDRVPVIVLAMVLAMAAICTARRDLETVHRGTCP